MKKQWKLVTYSALVLGALSVGNVEEASAAEWTARTPDQIEITDRSAYLIVWGDTLWAISEASGVSINALVEINQIANRDLIYAGNTLVIEGKTVTVTEQNGVKSSFVVEGNTVTPTENHAVAKAPAVVENVEDSGNFTSNVGHTDATQGGQLDEKSNDDEPKVNPSKEEESKVDNPKVEENKGTEVEADEEEDGGNFQFVTPGEEDEEETKTPETPETPVETPEVPETPETPDAPATPQLPARDPLSTVQQYGDFDYVINVDLGLGYSKDNPMTFPRYAFPGSEYVSAYVDGNNVVFSHSQHGNKTFPLSGGQTTYTDQWLDVVDTINIVIRPFGEVKVETPETPVEEPVVEESTLEERGNEAVVSLRNAVSGPYWANFTTEEMDVPGNLIVAASFGDGEDEYSTHEELLAAHAEIVSFMESKGHKLVMNNYGAMIENYFVISFQVN